MSYIDVTGKTENEAIEKALAELGLDRDDVSVEILERAKSGFLGIGATPAKVEVTYEAPDPAPKVALSSASRSAKPKERVEPTPSVISRPGKKIEPEKKPEKKKVDEEMVDRIVAEKNVRFKNDTQHGTAQKATFYAAKNILVLEGDPVLQDGENSIRGNVIRYFMNENRSVVEGSAKKRVHAVFSNEKKEK